MKLAGKTAIVTGGASGFGAGIVRRFWAEGAQVVIADLNDEAAGELAADLGETVQHLKADVTNDDDIRSMMIEESSITECGMIRCTHPKSLKLEEVVWPTRRRWIDRHELSRNSPREP